MTDKSDFEKENPDTSGLVKKLDYNTKNNEIESKIPSISGLPTNAALTTITTPEFDKFTAEIFTTRLAQTILITKRDFENKLMSLNKKINSNKAKHILV